jgi:hypothetical protein
MPPWAADGPLDIVETDGRPLFRAVRSEAFDPHDWRSNYEKGNPPIRLEKQAAIDHMAVSTWDDREVVERLISGVKKLRGCLIAEVRIPPGHGFWMANTSSLRHWDVWGWPDEFEPWIGPVASP